MDSYIRVGEPSFTEDSLSQRNKARNDVTFMSGSSFAIVRECIILPHICQSIAYLMTQTLFRLQIFVRSELTVHPLRPSLLHK